MVQHDQLLITMLQMGFPPHLVQLLDRWLHGCPDSSALLTVQILMVPCQERSPARIQPLTVPVQHFRGASDAKGSALKGFPGGLRIGGRTISNLRYADNIVLLATNITRRVTGAGEPCRESGKRIWLIHATKTKVMANAGVSVDGGRLEQVDFFTYLGSRVTSNADCVWVMWSRGWLWAWL